MFDAARRTVARFIGAPSDRGVIFTKNVTEAINLVAYSWGRANLKPGDAVLLTELEHHANIVPRLLLAEERGIEIRHTPIAEDHTLRSAKRPEGTECVSQSISRWGAESVTRKENY